MAGKNSVRIPVALELESDDIVKDYKTTINKISNINDLQSQFKELLKLQKQYIDNAKASTDPMMKALNLQGAKAYSEMLGRIQSQVEKIDKTKITPIFMLSGFDEKEFICISSNREYNFLSGTGNYDAVMVIPSDKRKKPYKAAQERVKDLINSDHKILPKQLLVIIPGTEEIDIESNKVDKRSKAYKVAQSFLKQLMEIKEDIHNEFGIKPADSWQKMYTLNKSKMSTPSDWNNLKWGMKGEELERVLQSNSLDQLFPDKDGVIYMSIDIPKDIQKQFDMHGSILLTKDEIKNIEFELNNDGSKNDEANYNKYGRSYSSLKNGSESGRVRGDRYGKEL